VGFRHASVHVRGEGASSSLSRLLFDCLDNGSCSDTSDERPLAKERRRIFLGTASYGLAESLA
jgi:hypothetical protein